MTLFFVFPVTLLFSWGVVALLRPALPFPWRWSQRGLILHLGIWLVLQSLLTLLIGRPLFAATISLAFLMLVVQVSNAKFHALREPFVFQDFEYFTDAIRHPRLYIPFLGWWKFVAIAIAVVFALAVGILLEAAPPDRWAWEGQLGFLVMSVLAGLTLIRMAGEGNPSFEPMRDLNRDGLLGSLWDYGVAEQRPLQALPAWPPIARSDGVRPDIVVVQSESFFDPRGLFSGIRTDVLGTFDRVRRESIMTGDVNVPAWGANTVRSEFAFLSGTPESELGVHRFNPYRRLRDNSVTSLAARLRSAGYRTVCIHPYPASFYRRNTVYPWLGFDAFLDITSFPGAIRSGPYIGDAAVAEKVGEVLGDSTQPLFVFVITMENHGPLHLEKVRPEDIPALYDAAPPAGCDDLTIYLRHLKNADSMIGQLVSLLAAHPRPAGLCWYGDHVPIMAEVYRQMGEPKGNTPYFIWGNKKAGDGRRCSLALHDLAACLLSALD